jgi:carbonic anhydrase
MFDIIYRFDPTQPVVRQLPTDAGEAQQRLAEGNREFASVLGTAPHAVPSGSRVVFFDLEDIGIGTAGRAPRQQPFAVVLGCSDARVPTELVFNRACNELFVVRVAGNLLGQEVLGSIDFAVRNFANSLKLVVVLGHSQCGAVTGAVDAFLHPADYFAVASSHPLRSVINGVFPSVRGAAAALHATHGEDVVRRPGYRAALIEAGVAVNAALAAAELRRDLANDLPQGAKVVFGVYDLETRLVGVPLVNKGPEVHLIEPPTDRAGFIRLGADIAHSALVERLLAGGSA